jgi:hypothetical protein
MLKTSISFFNELAIEKKNYAKKLSLIMDSKWKMVWKEYMSRYKLQPWLQRDIH